MQVLPSHPTFIHPTILYLVTQSEPSFERSSQNAQWNFVKTQRGSARPVGKYANLSSDATSHVTCTAQDVLLRVFPGHIIIFGAFLGKTVKFNNQYSLGWFT